MFRILVSIPTGIRVASLYADCANVVGWDRCCHFAERGPNGGGFFTVEEHCAGLGFDGFHDGGMGFRSAVLRLGRVSEK